MNLVNWFQQTSTIKQYLEHKLTHSYLKKYIENPHIDEERISFLLLPFYEEKHNERDIVKVISTVMLIQIALDTHEKVTNSNTDPLKERQLTVLAGDYFSGLYYKILADIDNVKLIRSLAEGTKLVNEHKIAVYKSEKNTLDGIITSIKKVESSIISKFYSFYQQEYWQELMEEFLLLRRLLAEKKLFENGSPSLLFESIKKVTFPNISEEKYLTKDQSKYLISICEDYISKVKKTLLNILEDIVIPVEIIESEIRILIQSPHHLRTKIYAEEG
ncbi:heptaprenyl diphosphate synthase [Bacillus pakistanensis]|uniref:Heptaprenyl diphosphate synthase n=1 Tax=Rossellomorea pakistanensis TaxID=992288 RepID=A0ABS2N925_9BACI|nr:heptaprenyl diphosphate synthase component 1 [Bacillus pakistanensis]MBM7584352.1 heptaprenyl diphosphate synthase [Bacillus pakistanensis]